MTTDCPAGFINPDGSQKCYGLWQTGHDYSDARRLCNSMSASIAAPTSSKENTDILDILKSAGKSRTWIGINDRYKEDEYKLPNNELATYFNWGSGMYRCTRIVLLCSLLF